MQNRFTILLILLFIVFFESKAQQHLTAMQAYDKAQQARSNANDLWGKDKASTAEIAKGIKILKNALVFLDSIPIRALAQGNIYLKARSNDIYLDLAQAYAISNQKELALSSLENMFSLGEPSGVVSYIQQDSALNSLRTEPRYLAVINKMTNQGKLWKNTAFKTTYKPDLLEAEKVAGLSLLWSMAKYNFVYFDHLQVDWNQLYMDYLPKVKNTNSTSEYYKVLISFYAQLKDGHTNVYVPNELSDEFYSRPPFRTELIEGRVFVTQVFSDSLLKSGINPGLEIVKIDAEPVISYAEKNIKPYQSSSTPQDMEVREFTYALLSGPKEKPILFEFRDRNGKIINRTIARTGYRDIRVLKTIEYEEIKNIGYLTINNFEDRNINKDFDSLYTKISKTKGLIIDIRYNGGGDGGIGFNIISKWSCYI
jgi:carboxyl-terminal processing protease